MEKKNTASRRAAPFVGAGIVIAIAFILVCAVGIYRYQWENDFVYSLSEYIPFPAFMVDWEVVRYRSYLDELHALRAFWQRQNVEGAGLVPLPNDDEIKNSVAKKLIDEHLLRIWARQNNVSVTTEEIDAEWERAAQLSDPEFNMEEFLASAYGWDPETFKRKILEPFLLRQKVHESIAAQMHMDDESLYQKALAIQKKAVEEGQDFASLARAHSEDPATRDIGGYKGYVGVGTFDIGIERILFGMESGEVSEPIQTTQGFYIFKVEDKLYDDYDDVAQIGLRYIFVKSFDFEQWLAEQKNNMAIYRLVS